MGKTAVVLVAVGLGGLFYYQRHHSAAPDQPEKPVASAHVTEVAKTQPQARAEPSEHNWMKRSLDRASDVAHQSRAQTQKSPDP
jgi:hypothetical protein